MFTGEAARLAQIEQKIFRDFMPDQHRELFEKLPLLFVGSLDARGRPWASVLAECPGLERLTVVGFLEIVLAISIVLPIVLGGYVLLAARARTVFKSERAVRRRS